MCKVCLIILNFLLLTLGLSDSRETDENEIIHKATVPITKLGIIPVSYVFYNVKLIVKQNILRTENKMHFFESTLQ